jgi:DNA-binding response OmpR family regulator
MGKGNALPNILIVDDDHDLLEGQRIYLEGRGYTVKTADSLNKGLETLDVFRPDLILADLMMEHYDTGFVFCKKARERHGMSKVPIIMQTSAARELGFAFDARDPEAKKWMNVDEVLTKPIPLEDLEGKIRAYVPR